MDIVKKKISGLIIVIGILLLFSLVLVQYYGPTLSQERRYQEINSKELLEELNAIQVSVMPVDESMPAENIAVINYHRIISTGSVTDDYSITYDEFKNHMLTLKKAGYETVNMAEIEEFLNGERQLPPKSFVLTFDDGIKDTYYMADNMLKELNYEAVMFVVTSQSVEKDGPYYLNKKELIKMHKSGRWDIQSHSHDGHDRVRISKEGDLGPYLTNLIWLEKEERLETSEEYEARIMNDLSKSRFLLEGLLDKEIIGFALPFGDFGQRITNYPGSEEILIRTAAENFRLIFYQFKPSINRDYRANFQKHKDSLVMRISADTLSANKLLAILEASNSVSLPYEENYGNEYQWINLWGKNEINGQMLGIGSISDGGAMSYLDGSYLWEDYLFEANLEYNAAKNVFLVSRFHDIQNYVACKYEEGHISIRKVIGGDKEIIANEEISNNNGFKGSKLGMAVKEDTITCYLDNYPVVEITDFGIPQNGGIGFLVEKFNAPNTWVIFSRIKVTPKF